MTHYTNAIVFMVKVKSFFTQCFDNYYWQLEIKKISRKDKTIMGQNNGYSIRKFHLMFKIN